MSTPRFRWRPSGSPARSSSLRRRYGAVSRLISRDGCRCRWSTTEAAGHPRRPRRHRPGEPRPAERSGCCPGWRRSSPTAIDREILLRSTVETEALRRSDELKTALLRTVSHDLRTPITAIRAAAEALTSATIGETDRADLREAIIDDSDRLAELVDNLLDLSRLRTGTAEPSTDWTSIEEVIEAAMDDLDIDPDRFQLSIDERLPFIRPTPPSSSASSSMCSPTRQGTRMAR